jgi:integrase
VGKDVWLVDFFDATGKRRRVTAPTRAAAELLFAEKVAQSRQAAPPVQDPDISVARYAAGWLEEVRTTLEPRTHRSYAQLLRLHILPAFGGMKLRALHRGHIKALLNEKRRLGLSKNTVRLIRATLSVLLSDAVDAGIIFANPASGIARRGRKRADAVTVQHDRARSAP